MLPENLHVEQINRFHAMMKTLDEKIQQEPDETKKAKMCLQYYELTKLWKAIDDFIEYTVKEELDRITFIFI